MALLSWSSPLTSSPSLPIPPKPDPISAPLHWVSCYNAVSSTRGAFILRLMQPPLGVSLRTSSSALSQMSASFPATYTHTMSVFSPKHLSDRMSYVPICCFQCAYLRRAGLYFFFLSLSLHCWGWNPKPYTCWVRPLPLTYIPKTRNSLLFFAVTRGAQIC